MNKNRLYWSAQLLGWLCFSICIILITIGPTASFVELLLLILANTSLGVLISQGLFVYFSKNNFSLPYLKSNLQECIGASFCCVLVSAFCLKGFTTILFPSNTQITWLNAFLISFLGIGIWLSLYITIRSIKQFYRDLRTEATVQNLIRTTELDNLKSQLNPHFLFNSLNSIKALVRIDPPLAQKSIIQLSDILRKSLTISEIPMVNLIEELSMMQQYLDLEKIRFDKRLTYHFKIENQSLNCRIPSMSLYLLVENSIKHGISKLRKGGELFIHTRIDGNSLFIIVRNTGGLEKKEHFFGTSLNNLAKRLQVMYAGKASLRVTEEENMVIAILAIPLDFNGIIS